MRTSLSTFAEMTDQELLKEASSEAVDELLSRYKQEVRRLSRAYFLIGSDQQDLLQEGMIGLYKAISSYRPEVGEFLPFARVCITRQLINAVRSSLREKHQPLNEALSLEQTILKDEDGEERTMGDLLPDPITRSPEETTIEAEEASLLSRKIEEALSPMEQKVLELYLSGDDYHQISEHLSITPKSADNAIQRIRKKVKKLFTSTR